MYLPVDISWVNTRVCDWQTRDMGIISDDGLAPIQQQAIICTINC